MATFTEHHDPTSGLPYFVDDATGETTWERPEGVSAMRTNPIAPGTATASSTTAAGDGSDGATMTCTCPPPPEGHCMTCTCCLTPGCKRAWGIAFSVISLVLGVISALRGAVMLLCALLIIVLPVDAESHNLLFLFVTGSPVYFSTSSVWYLGEGSRLFYGSSWFMSSMGSLIFGALLILPALAHPKKMPCFASLGAKNPMWLLDPLMRLGGVGQLILISASYGGALGFYWGVYAATGATFTVLAIVDCFIHFLPQPAPLLSSQCGGGACGEQAESVGGLELEECEGDTDLQGTPCIAFACSNRKCCPGGFRGGTIFSIMNLSFALCGMFGGIFGNGVVGNNWTAIGAVAYTFTSLGSWIIFTSLITPKSIWKNLWFLDFLRSFVGMGLLLLYFSLTNIHWVAWIFYPNSPAAKSIAFNSWLSLINALSLIACAIAYIVFGLINICCREKCCKGGGIPLPFPILRYWIKASPTLIFQKTSDPGVDRGPRPSREPKEGAGMTSESSPI